MGPVFRDTLVIPLLSTSDAEAAHSLNALSFAHGLHPWLDADRVHHRGHDEKLVTQLAAMVIPALMQPGLAGCSNASAFAQTSTATQRSLIEPVAQRPADGGAIMTFAFLTGSPTRSVGDHRPGSAGR